MINYHYYNSEDGERNGVYVYRLIDGEWRYWSRIAKHGMENIFADGGWRIHGEGWQTTALFIEDWGSGERSALVNGQFVPASHPSLDRRLVG